MGSPLPLLLLGGTTEASALARALAGDGRFAPTLSLAGRTSAPQRPPIPWRLGGFGGTEGLAEYLRATGTRLLLDATHPFAATMKRHAADAARLAGAARLTLLRPAWQPGPGDRWTDVPGMAEAAAALGVAPRRVFLAIGRQELAAFAAAPWHRYLVRSIDPPDPGLLPPGAEWIAARGPFGDAAERALLAAHRIELVVAKNAGGAATRGKLDAARALGLPVVLVRRPPPPEPPLAPDVAAALRWLDGVHAGIAARGA